MTFQDMVKKDPQGNLTAEHRTVDATGTYYLLGQPARRIELLYIYIYANPITGESTPTKSIAFETIVSGRHITITMSTLAVDFDKYTPIFTQMLGSFKLNGGS